MPACVPAPLSEFLLIRSLRGLKLCRHGVIFAVAASSTWGNSMPLFALELRTHMSVIKNRSGPVFAGSDVADAEAVMLF